MEEERCLNCNNILTEDEELETGFCLECFDDLLNT